MAPDHPKLSVVRKPGKTKTRKSYRLTAFSTSDNFCVQNTNLNSIVRSIKERLFYVVCDGGFTPTPEPAYSGVFEDRCGEFRRLFHKHVQYAAPMSTDDFLATFEGRRRTVYEKAAKSLSVFCYKKSDAYVSFFQKCEKINYTSKPDSAPRGISPRSPRYGMSVGPYIKRIEKKIYKVIAAVFGAVTVFKGLNAFASGKQLRSHWDDFNHPVAVGLDASRFDQHVSESALEFEHSFYTMFFPNDSKLVKLLRAQLVNKCFAHVPDGDVKFSLNGKRMSGDFNTGLGNCLLMCMMVYAFCHFVGIKKFRLANNGDDCVLIVEKKDLVKLATLHSYFLDFGFNMKCEKPVYVFEQIEFCQTHPIWTPDGWLMVRNVPTSIAKDCLSLKPLDNVKVFKRWCASVAQCGLSLTGGIPIVQEFYMALSRSSMGAKILEREPTLESGFARLAIGMRRKYAEVHPMTRVSFWRAFDISPDKQIAFENVYRDAKIHYDQQQCAWEPYNIML